MKPTFNMFHAAAALAAFTIGALGLQAQEAKPGGGASTREQAPASATGQAGAQLDKSDQQFVTKASQSGMMEVQLGELASQKATAQPVKELAAMMAKDHAKANQELEGIVGKKGLALPKEMDSKHQAKIDKLSKLSGAQFDKEYIDESIAGHKRGVSEFEKAAKSAKDPDIKAFAEKTVPTLQAHLQQAQALKKNGGADARATTTPGRD
jgi:putative membrane protein